MRTIYASHILRNDIINNELLDILCNRIKDNGWTSKKLSKSYHIIKPQDDNGDYSNRTVLEVDNFLNILNKSEQTSIEIKYNNDLSEN